MNNLSIFTLKFLKAGYQLMIDIAPPSYKYQFNTIESKKLISGLLLDQSPCMIARYGAYESAVLLNYLGTKEINHSVIKYIKGECSEWWWNENLLRAFQNNAGFFSINVKNIEKYCELTLEDSKQADVLGSFEHNSNTYKLHRFTNNSHIIRLKDLEPDYKLEDSSQEWVACLKGKRVLVISPFEKTIQKQYQKRTKLFPDPHFLPDFELKTIKAVQSIAGNHQGYKTWFDALYSMEEQMDKIDYDVAIIGCGAYGFNLAAHSKRTGHKAIHLGGATQLLFGIRGRRWEQNSELCQIMNDYWTRPSKEEKPETSSTVEDGAYW